MYNPNVALSLSAKPSGEVWLHMNSPLSGKRAAVNLGIFPPGTVTGSLLQRLVGEGSPDIRLKVFGDSHWLLLFENGEERASVLVQSGLPIIRAVMDEITGPIFAPALPDPVDIKPGDLFWDKYHLELIGYDTDVCYLVLSAESTHDNPVRFLYRCARFVWCEPNGGGSYRGACDGYFYAAELEHLTKVGNISQLKSFGPEAELCGGPPFLQQPKAAT